MCHLHHTPLPFDAPKCFLCPHMPRNVQSISSGAKAALGFPVIIVQWPLEPLIAWIEKRQQRHSYSSAEWRANEVFQLQRLAHEELGYGTWTGCADAVPLCLDHEKLGVLDTSDPEHPRLQVCPVM